MNNEQDYIEINKKAWNNKTQHHVESAFYNMPAFLAGQNTLHSIELELLGDVSGKKVLHLQCHFGQDTISFARMGVHATGVDFSEAAINKARELSLQTGAHAKFICCDIYDLPNHLDEEFDIVFTSYGTIGWLPDVDRWAAVVSHFLKPGGTFVIADFHPIVWTFDANFEKIGYNYFKEDAIVEIEMGTYADITAPVENKTVSWNHSLSEILNSLINNKLDIKTFNEYDYSPYSCFNNLEEYEPGRYRVAHIGNKIPMVYAIKAVKKDNR